MVERQHETYIHQPKELWLEDLNILAIALFKCVSSACKLDLPYTPIKPKYF